MWDVLLNPLWSSQVSSYGGYLRYRLYTQTMRGDVLSLPAEASRPDILLKVLTRGSWAKQNQLSRAELCIREPPKRQNIVLVLQGNQMTLAFMEREYFPPEEPHLGIVHIVEVGTFPRPHQQPHGASSSLSWKRQLQHDKASIYLFTVVKWSNIESE